MNYYYIMEKFVIKNTDLNDEESDLSSFEDDNESDNDDTEDLSNSDIKDAVDPLTFFSSKELCYYKTIHKFFKNCNDKEIIRMINIINGESEISLRVLDWFVTRYSKRKIDFGDNQENTLDSFDVHISYKSELKSYKKRYFDPFRRRKKFYYLLYLKETNFKSTNSHNESNDSKDTLLLYTTLGQLNFFMWAISNKIIDYVQVNLEQVSKAMNTNNKDEKKKKQKIISKKKDKTKISVSEVLDKKVKKDDKKRNSNNNVFNNYYEDSEDENHLVLNFD
jgi:hypothetical protein